MSKRPKAIPMYELIIKPPFDVPVIHDHSLDKRMTIPLIEMQGYAGISQKSIERLYKLMKFLRRQNLRLKDALEHQQTKGERK